MEVNLKSGRDEALTQQCVAALCALGAEELAEKVGVDWNPRMRSTAGRAFYRDSRIELNAKLEVIAPDEVQRTLLHELAHLLAHHRGGRTRIQSHGIEWKQACVDLGISGEKATHSLPLPKRKQRKKWRYTCPVCKDGFDRVRRMKKIAACYACCKTHNRGRYSKKFNFVESQLD